MPRDSEMLWEDTKIIAVPGMPGANPPLPDEADDVYPVATIDFIKQLRADGFPAEIASPRESQKLLSYNADELWLPLLNIGLSVITGAAGNLIASLIDRAIHGNEKTLVHIRWQVRDRKGRKHKFDFDGPAREAKAVATVFENALRHETDKHE